MLPEPPVSGRAGLIVSSESPPSWKDSSRVRCVGGCVTQTTCRFPLGLSFIGVTDDEIGVYVSICGVDSLREIRPASNQSRTMPSQFDVSSGILQDGTGRFSDCTWFL